MTHNWSLLDSPDPRHHAHRSARRHSSPNADFWIYLLAFCAEVLMVGHWLFQRGARPGSVDYDTLGQDIQIFAGIFQFFYLRIAIFFGCVGIFSNLFRGEMMDKSLHYYMLAPVRREVLVDGKFLSGLTCRNSHLLGLRRCFSGPGDVLASRQGTDEMHTCSPARGCPTLCVVLCSVGIGVRRLWQPVPRVGCAGTATR